MRECIRMKTFTLSLETRLLSRAKNSHSQHLTVNMQLR